VNHFARPASQRTPAMMPSDPVHRSPNKIIDRSLCAYALLNNGIHLELLDSAHKIGTVLFGHPRSNTTPSSRLPYRSDQFFSRNTPCAFASSRARVRCSGSGNALVAALRRRLARVAIPRGTLRPSKGGL
jgi:hypothetical protein